MTIRFLIDAQLPPGLAQRLATYGYTAEHVNRIGLGAADDATIWQHAAKTGATLVTKDEDFVALANRDPSGPQIVWVRIGNVTNEALWGAIEPQMTEIVQAIEAGERIVEIL